jgi:hypothetical protein
MIISAFNPETFDLEKTYLSSFIAAAGTSLAVKNNSEFAATNKILVGEMGQEKSEIRTVSSVNANKLAIVVDALLFDHNADVSVYKLAYNQIRFYRRTSIGAAPILQTTVDIDVDDADKITRWDDTTSLTTYFYQTAFYNSVTTEESELSDPISAVGYDIKSAGAIIDQVVRRVRDTGYTVLSFNEYIDVMNEVGSDLITQAQRPYTFLKKKTLLDTVADQAYIDLPVDLWKFNHVFTGYISGGVTRFTEKTPLTEEQFNQRYDSSNYPAQDNILDVAIDEDNTQILIHPKAKTAQTGIVKLSYYKTFTPITKAGDLIETPNNLIYRYKLMAEYYSAKSEVDRQWANLAQKYEDKYGSEVVKMQRSNRLDVGTPRSFKSPRAYRRRRYTL